jgi:hypothetical protein
MDPRTDHFAQRVLAVKRLGASVSACASAPVGPAAPGFHWRGRALRGAGVALAFVRNQTVRAVVLPAIDRLLAA